jgi:hypothetical protein
MALNHLCWRHCQRGMIDAFMYVLHKTYTEREGSKRCMKSWTLGNTECDDQNFRGDLCPYIFIGFRIIYLQRRSILARPTRDGRLKKLILLSPG